jgi:hypothetical protein
LVKLVCLPSVCTVGGGGEGSRKKWPEKMPKGGERIFWEDDRGRRRMDHVQADTGVPPYTVGQRFKRDGIVELCLKLLCGYSFIHSFILHFQYLLSDYNKEMEQTAVNQTHKVPWPHEATS